MSAFPMSCTTSSRVQPFILVSVLASLMVGCVTSHEDGQQLSSRTEQVQLEGYASQPSVKLTLQGWAHKDEQWDALASTTSVKGEGPSQLYAWKMPPLSLGSKYWRLATGGDYEARLRVLEAGLDTSLPTFTAEGFACLAEKIEDGESPFNAGYACHTGLELTFVAPGPSPNSPNPPGAGASGGGGGASCPDTGMPCVVAPKECFGRGSEWKVSGTIECHDGVSVCVAEQGSDYCTTCGGSCGACQICSASNLCAPGSVCGTEHTPTGTRMICRPFTPCDKINGFCWTPDEVGMETLICANAD